ncbi:unnamed protein product [Moneuplotes crassus]|uniref:Uncharacterized protein n=1 Tax=Euplotes crassus TaxID=5936 RepID=A0AAD2D1C8_EUPCR|nr:unnamed protein product [Moneuplotes crassus]
MEPDNIGTEVSYPKKPTFKVLLKCLNDDSKWDQNDLDEEQKQFPKYRDMDIQTDYTLSDIENFEVYKDWYVKESWSAFAQIAKFRKEIIREIKKDYIKKAYFKISKKYSKQVKGINSMSPIQRKRFKTGENEELEGSSSQDGYSEAFLRNSLQKTCEIVIKTNRLNLDKKKIKEPSYQDTLQEFSCQAYMQVPSQTNAVTSPISDGIQTFLKVDSKDRNIQATTCGTVMTSTQTFSDCTAGLDVSLQFPSNSTLQTRSRPEEEERSGKVYKDVAI